MEQEEEDLSAGHEPILSLPEIIVIGFYVVIIDLIEVALLFFGLDDFFILDLAAAPVGIWLFFRGVSSTRYAVMYILEFIPWVGDLPLLTIGFFATVYLDRHPKLEAVVKKAGGAASAVKGRAGGGKAGIGEKFSAATTGASGLRETGAIKEGREIIKGMREAWGNGGEGPGEEEETPQEKKKKERESLEEAETGTYGMPPEPLSKEEQRSIFEETPGKQEPSNAVPFPQKKSDGERVILKDNEVNLKKEAA